MQLLLKNKHHILQKRRSQSRSHAAKRKTSSTKLIVHKVAEIKPG